MKAANHYEISVIRHDQDRVAVRLITMDGDAPKGTISDIREVQGATVESCLANVWNWFVNDDRLTLQDANGRVYAYRGAKTFIKAALQLVEDNEKKFTAGQNIICNTGHKGVFVRYLDEPRVYAKPDGGETVLDCVVTTSGHNIMVTSSDWV